jgi:drug/metabolite transporter (DMT)-like permease
LGTYALQQLSAFTANLTVNLEPIYGIVLGALIFHENQDLNVWFYTGTGIILSAIFAQAYLSNRKQTPINPGQAQG